MERQTRAIHVRDVLASTERVTGPVDTLPFSQLVVAVFAVWYLAFPKIVTRFDTVFRTLADPSGGGSSAATYGSTVAQYSPSLVDVVRSRTSDTVFRSTFVGALGLFTALSALFFVVDLIVGFGRPLVYAELFGALLAGASIYALAEHTGSRTGVYESVYPDYREF